MIQSSCLHNYLNLLENERNYIIAKNSNSEFQAANKRFLNKVNIENDELIGLTDFDLWEAHLANKYQKDDRRVFAMHMLKNFIEPHPQACGTIGYSLVNKYSIHDEHLSSPGLIVEFEDVTPTTLLMKELTFRQIQCIKPIIRGYTAKEIANSLNISSRTVEAHLDHIKQIFKANYTRDLIKKVHELPKFDVLLEQFINNYTELHIILKSVYSS